MLLYVLFLGIGNAATTVLFFPLLTDLVPASRVSKFAWISAFAGQGSGTRFAHAFLSLPKFAPRESVMTDVQTPPEIRLQQGPAGRASRQLKAFRLLVRALFLLLFRVRVTGMENALRVPSIICFNHLGWAEGFMVLLFFPVEPRIYGLGERQVAYIAPWRTRLLNWLQIFIPLDRDKPRQALKTMAGVIERGGSLAMAPEGHLGYVEGTISELQEGAAYLSQTTGAPIVPAGATGVLELWLRCRLTLRVGPPIYPGEFQGDLRTRTHAMTARLDREMRALLSGDVERPRAKLLRQWLTKLF